LSILALLQIFAGRAGVIDDMVGLDAHRFWCLAFLIGVLAIMTNFTQFWITDRDGVMYLDEEVGGMCIIIRT
jgi:hypothetical protein